MVLQNVNGTGQVHPATPGSGHAFLVPIMTVTNGEYMFIQGTG